MGQGFKTLRHLGVGEAEAGRECENLSASGGRGEKKYQRGDLMALFWWELSCPLPARSEAVCLHALSR